MTRRFGQRRCIVPTPSASRLLGRRSIGVALLALLLAAAQPAPASDVIGGAIVDLTKRVSGPTPFADDCDDSGPGAGIPGAEVEVHLAVDPSDPDHLVATWQQDRYSSGGAARSNLVAFSRNGGRTWSRSTIPDLTWCTGPHQAPIRPRATDPWVAIGADGTAYLASTTALVTDLDVDLDLPIATSPDGGRSWPSPVPVAIDNGVFWHEKPEIAADPLIPGRAYAVWARHLTPDPFDVFATLDVDMAFARTEDGGRTWSWSDENPSIIPPDVEGRLEAAQDIATVRRNGGTSIVVGFAVWNNRLNPTTIEMFTTHSEDGGRTWSQPGRIALKTPLPIGDAEKATEPQPRQIEDGQLLVPSLAVAPDGTLYTVWHDHTPTGDHPLGGSLIHLARSEDLGETWSMVETMDVPFPVLLPEAAVADDGTVGVSFYDFRNDVFGDGPLTTDVWLRYSRNRGENWEEIHLAGPFDMRSAPVDSGGARYFLGDYSGMVGLSRGFGVLAALAEPIAKTDRRCCPEGLQGQSDVFFIRVNLAS